MGFRNLPFALVILAACTQAPVGRVSAIQGDTGGIDSSVRYEAADGVIPVAIRGNPFTGTKEETAVAIASVLHLPPGWPRASFASTPRAELGQGVRLVLVFNALDPLLEARQLCSGAEEIELAPRAETTRIMAAFCIGPRLGRGASASGPAPAAMNPGFSALLDDVVQNVFRLRTPRSGNMS